MEENREYTVIPKNINEIKETNLIVAGKGFYKLTSYEFVSGGTDYDSGNSHTKVEQDYDTTPSKIKHIDPKDYDGPQHSEELETYWVKAVEVMEEDGDILPGLTRLAYRRERPDWIGAFNQKAVEKEFANYKILAKLQEEVDVIESRLFQLEVVPTADRWGNPFGLEELTQAEKSNAYKRNQLHYRHVKLMALVAEMENKINEL